MAFSLKTVSCASMLASAVLSGCAFVPRSDRSEAVRDAAEQTEWLRSRAHPVKVAGDDFADLKPIADAIGDTRVVMLGELTHGDGTGFLAKVRLVQFLHQQKGFDVLVWESGLFDCAEMNREIGGEKDLFNVAKMGVFPHWSVGSESFPVFEYARASHKSPRPLQMAGFDLQTSGSAGNSRWPTFLEWIGETRGREAGIHQKLSGLLADAAKISSAADPVQEQQRIQKELGKLAAPIAQLYRDHRLELMTELGADEYGFRLRCLESEVEYATMLELFGKAMRDQDDASMQKSYNLRERVNADNLLWLLRNRYPGKKLIVWAHNVHICGIHPTGEGVTPERESTGRLLKRKLGSQLYALGFVGYSGKWAWLDNPTIDYASAPDGSLEAVLGATGLEQGFLNLRHCRLPGHWLMTSRQGFLDQQAQTLVSLRWPQAYDGIWFVRTMQPRKGLASGGGAAKGSN